jgi:hypothetical protein
MSTVDPAQQPSEKPAPPSFSSGRFAGIGNGRVVIVSNSLDEVVRRLDEVGAERQEVEIWEVAQDCDKVGYVWSCRRCAPERSGGFPGRTLFPGNPIMQRNEEVARQINEEARADPTSPYAGKWVILIRGQVAAVVDSWDELNRTLDQLGASPAETYCFEASRDYDEVMDIG